MGNVVPLRVVALSPCLAYGLPSRSSRDRLPRPDLFATLRIGTKVTISTPRDTWTYTVYADYVTPGRGAPAAGLYWGDLTLQSCVGPDTRFSYLVRD